MQVRSVPPPQAVVSDRTLTFVSALAIRLGHELGIKSILHAAYYDHNSILYIPLHPLDEYFDGRHTRDINIGNENLLRFFHGRERMKEAVSLFIEQEFTQNSPYTDSALASTHHSCTLPQDSELRRQCRDAVSKWQDQTYDFLRDHWSPVLQDPVGHFRRLADQFDNEESFQPNQEICTSCRSRLAATLRAHSMRIWNDVPSYFDLQSA